MAKTEQKPAAKPGSALERLKARTAPVAVQEGGEREIPLAKIQFDSGQPRSAFHHPDGQISTEDTKKVEELAESIDAQGLIQPITVRPGPNDTFIVVVGERRTRAHLLLGKTTIRAYVRGDLAESVSKRKLVQLVENVVRDDLPDHDVARTIKELMEGTAGEPPMSQSEIAKALSKSEGYVSRYVRFGKEELQRLWVKTGIVDTVEHLYRVSVLPEPLQAEIQRRVNLDAEHPDFLAKPLSRGLLDEMARQAKIAKKAGAVGHGQAAQGTGTQPPAEQPSRTGGQSSAGAAAGPKSDPVTQALTQAAADGQSAGSNAAPQSSTTITGTNYQLPEEVRAQILAGAGVVPDESNASATLPPTTLRGPLHALVALIEKLDEADVAAAQALIASVALPAPLAQALANKVAGLVVEPRAVAPTLQRHLSEG